MFVGGSKHPSVCKPVRCPPRNPRQSSWVLPSPSALLHNSIFINYVNFTQLKVSSILVKKHLWEGRLHTFSLGVSMRPAIPLCVVLNTVEHFLYPPQCCGISCIDFSSSVVKTLNAQYVTFFWLCDSGYNVLSTNNKSILNSVPVHVNVLTCWWVHVGLLQHWWQD